jgi:hypothetical protein
MNEGETCAADEDCSPLLEADYLSALTDFTRVSDPADADYAIIRLASRKGSYFGWDGGVPLAWAHYGACTGGTHDELPCELDDDCNDGTCDTDMLAAFPVYIYDQETDYPMLENPLVCVGGTDAGDRCGDDDDCNDGTCELVLMCVGGTDDGDECTGSNCADGSCVNEEANPAQYALSTAGGGWGGSTVDNNAAALRSAQKLHDLIAVRDTNADLKIIVVVSMYRPFIIEPWLDDIDVFAAEFGMTDAALLDMVFQMTDGAADSSLQPTGTLPMELPSSQWAVYDALEDLPHDSLNPSFNIRAGSTAY